MRHSCYERVRNGETTGRRKDIARLQDGFSSVITKIRKYYKDVRFKNFNQQKYQSSFLSFKFIYS